MKSAQDEALQKGKKRKEKNEHLTPTKNTNIAELDYAVYIMTSGRKSCTHCWRLRFCLR